jgi:hypothetical protein
MSEQQEGLELDTEEQALDDPKTWRRADPDREPASTEDRPAGAQLTKPGGGGEPGDEEPTEIAEEYEPSTTVGPEQQAMHVEDER